MLTKLIVRNFKRFREVEIELGNPVIFIGPNNSGKTTALQSLALWDIGLKRWNEKRAGKKAPKKRAGVSINRRDLLAVPVPQANLLWRDLHVRDVSMTDGKQQTKNVRVDVVVEGVTHGEAWTCGLEFDYANEESLYCRPLRLSDEANPDRMSIPERAHDVNVCFLPPMSGLTDREFAKQPGEIGFLIGQGQTAAVLRNLCYQIITGADGPDQWSRICAQIKALFGVTLQAPQYIAERSEITMAYRERSGVQFDLSSSGRGLQQTLLLLAFLALHPGSVLLLDEPDAHLEILRQRQIYDELTQAARQQESQIIAASHSEILLNEAAHRDVVIAFVGKPHRLGGGGAQLAKSLKEIGFEQYYQAIQTGWVLYLEGSTDLAILRAFAQTLGHPARAHLDRPFVCYVGNKQSKAWDHFFGLREAKADLVGLALYDRDVRAGEARPGLTEHIWARREIENYLCQRETLLAWARSASAEGQDAPLFAARWPEVMEQQIRELEEALDRLGKPSPWSADMKVTDEFLDPLFQGFFKELRLTNLLRKTDYHALARFVAQDALDGEVGVVLDEIVRVASQAKPEVEAQDG